MIHLAAASVLSNHELEQTIDNRAVLIMLRRIDEEFLAGLRGQLRTARVAFA